MFKHTYWDKIFYWIGVIFAILAIVYSQIDFLLISISCIVSSWVAGGYNCFIDEQNYIWRMNNGPSSINRARLLRNKETGKSEFIVWVGGENGYYKGSDNRKFDYYLQEIK